MPINNSGLSLNPPRPIKVGVVVAAARCATDHSGSALAGGGGGVATGAVIGLDGWSVSRTLPNILRLWLIISPMSPTMLPAFWISVSSAIFTPYATGPFSPRTSSQRIGKLSGAFVAQLMSALKFVSGPNGR